MQTKDEDRQAAARAMIKSVFDDKEAEINGRKYQFLTMTHKKRRKVYAFYSQVAGAIQANNHGFLEFPEFEAIESIINDFITFDGSLISRLPNHWDEYPGDYIAFITTALTVISYPFLAASLTD